MENLSLYEDKLQFYLVKSSTESQLSSHMQFALEKLEENVCRTNIKCVTPDECIALSGNFTKKHIVVFDEFKGDCFDNIKKTQALVLGPRSVISCMMDNVTVPHIDSPMFNLAMMDLVVCLSSFSQQEKIKLGTLIGYMGGMCIDVLAEAVTHLVTESVRTKKYEIAVKANKNIMKASWVYEVWKESSVENVLATSQQFTKHKLPAFNQLRVTTTGLSRKVKKEVEELIIKEGGKYLGEFSSNSIDIVIASRNATETPKLKAALNQRKDCLCVEWVTDSYKQKAALPFDEYRIDLQAKKTTSTPEKRSSGNQFDNTQGSVGDLSNINFAGTINDTAMSNLSIVSDVSSGSRKRKSNDAANENKDTSYKVAFEKLDIKEAKRAGTFLDGCNIFICGFSTEEKEKIVKILNAGGATRYDTIHSNLSHILIGSPTKKDLTMLQAVKTDAILVKLDWLLESISKKVAVDADQFVFQLNTGKPNAMADEQATAPSPASKRNILLMSGQTPKQGTPKRLNFNDTNSSMSKDQSPSDKTLTPQASAVEDEIIDQYLKAPAPVAAKPLATPSVQATPSSSESEAGPSKVNDVFKVPAAPFSNTACDQISDLESESDFGSASVNPVMFLANLKVYVRGFDKESHESLVNDCRMAGAEVFDDADFSGSVDVMILPMDAMSMAGIKAKAKTIVNHNWLINAKRLHMHESTPVGLMAIIDSAEIPYFYKPILWPEELLPLSNLVVVFSLYSSDERAFLLQLAEIMGASVQESYSRQSKPLLICSEAKSAKYDAAIRWRLTVVNKNWLLDCHKFQKRVPLRDYLVGDSIVSVDHQIEEEDDEILSSQPVAQFESRDSNKETPVFQNRRIEQLRGAKPQSNPDSPLIPTRNPEILNMLDTPTRESLLQSFKELEEETPQSKRRRYEERGIHTPEEATTPYWKEFKTQQLEERRTRHAPTQEQIDKIKNRTPWSEIKRNLWKEALGDEYESPSQCYSANMAHEIGHSNEPTTSRSTAPPAGRHLQFDSPAETEANEHIQMLADFINKGKRNSNDNAQYVDLPNTAPAETELVNTEQLEVIGWRDPSETVEDTPKRNSKAKITPCFSISCAAEEVKLKLIKQINSLNGKVCENLLKYDSACTHFICERPSRSEKMLSCVASGKWILSLSYVQKSFEANHFLDEEEFEWGNPKATKLPKLEIASEINIAKAAFRWRKKLQSMVMPSAKGIFKDFRVILKTLKNDSFRTLMEAGKGKIVEIDNDVPLDKQLKQLTEATHIICQTNCTSFTPDEIKALEKANVYPVTMNYLQSYIIDEAVPDVKKFLFKTSKA